MLTILKCLVAFLKAIWPCGSLDDAEVNYKSHLGISPEPRRSKKKPLWLAALRLWHERAFAATVSGLLRWAAAQRLHRVYLTTVTHELCSARHTERLSKYG